MVLFIGRPLSSASTTIFFFVHSYTQNGLLHMLDRNRRIKKYPEKFQLCKEYFDIIITAEERVYDQVIEFMESKTASRNQPVHVINMDIQDNHEEATLGAFLICDMIQMMANSDDLDNDIDELLHDFEAKNQRPVLHCVLFYWLLSRWCLWLDGIANQMINCASIIRSPKSQHYTLYFVRIRGNRDHLLYHYYSILFKRKKNERINVINLNDF